MHDTQAAVGAVEVAIGAAVVAVDVGVHADAVHDVVADLVHCP